MPVFLTNENQNENQSHHVRVIFPALRASYRQLLWTVIGSRRCLFVLRLVGVIALDLVFRQSFENRSKHKCLVWLFQSHASIFVLNHCLLTLVFIKKMLFPISLQTEIIRSDEILDENLTMKEVCRIYGLYSKVNNYCSCLSNNFWTQLLLSFTGILKSVLDDNTVWSCLKKFLFSVHLITWRGHSFAGIMITCCGFTRRSIWGVEFRIP